MPSTEWHIPFEMQTSQGTLTFNQGSYPRFNLDQAGCKARRRIRANSDDIPQGDGEVFPKPFSGGYEMTLVVQPWLSENQFACPGLEINGASVVTMRDELYGHLWALLHPDDDGGRVIWTPTGQSNRMLDAVRLLDIADPRIDAETGQVIFEFTVDTPFPYAISEAQTITSFGAFSSGTAGNNGNVEFWPVIKMNGDGGLIIDNTTGFQILINSGCLGAGSYIEIDCFRMTAYVDGDQANAKPCVDVQSTDFFAIVPGGNQISTTVSCDFLLNDAYA